MSWIQSEASEANGSGKGWSQTRFADQIFWSVLLPLIVQPLRRPHGSYTMAMCDNKDLFVSFLGSMSPVVKSLSMNLNVFWSVTESHIVPKHETTFFGLCCSAGNSSRHDYKLLVNFEHGILAVLYTCKTCLNNLGSSFLSLVKGRVLSKYAFF